MRIPLPPIPESIGTKLRRFLTSSLPLLLWRTVILLVALGALYLAAQSGGFLVAFLVTSIIAAFYMDDITQALLDLWNANFAELKL